MFLVFYTVHLYILCTFDLVHILLALWKTHGSMECIYMHTYIHIHMYMCVCVCVCVCMYIYIYTCMYSSTKPKFKNFNCNSSTLFPVCENSGVLKTKSISFTLYFHPLQTLRLVKSIKGVHIVFLIF